MMNHFVQQRQDSNALLPSVDEELRSSQNGGGREDATSLMSYNGSNGGRANNNLFANNGNSDDDYYSSIQNADNGSSLADDGSSMKTSDDGGGGGDGVFEGEYHRRMSSISAVLDRRHSSSADDDANTTTASVTKNYVENSRTYKTTSRPRAARIRNRHQPSQPSQQHETSSPSAASLRQRSSHSPSAASTASMTISVVTSENGSYVIKNEQEWRNTNEASRTSSGTTLNSRRFISTNNNNDNNGSNFVVAAMDEPDEQSSEFFVPSVANKLKSLSAAIDNHVEAYRNSSKASAEQRLFAVRDVNANRLETDLNNVKQVMHNYGSATNQMTSEVGALLAKLNNLNETMSERLASDHQNAEGLVAQARQIKRSNETADQRAARILRLTGESESSIRAAEMNAKTAENVAKAMQMVSHLMTNLEEIRQVTVEAQAEADLAREQAEAEQQAEELRRKKEEEARRKAEEAQRLREEEDRKRAAERERIAAEMARKASLAGTASGDAQVSAAEVARNPRYWPHFIYDNKTPNAFDQGIIAIIRAFPKEIERSDIIVEVLDQADTVIELKEGEELLSNVVKLSYANDDDLSERLSAPLSILLPHCGARLPAYREAAIKFVGKSGRWREVTTTEVQLDEYKDVKFVECRLKPLGTFVVITRIRHDTHVMQPQGCLITSNIDSRVSFEIPANAVRIQTKLIVRLQPVESSMLAEFKRQIPFEEGEWLSGTSHFVFLSMLNHNVKQPVTLHIPAPPSLAARQKHLPIKKPPSKMEPDEPPPPPKPMTREERLAAAAAAKKPQMSLEDAINAALAAERAALEPETNITEDYMNKPLTGIMGKEKEEEIILVAYDPDLGPVIINDCQITEGKKDNLLVSLKTIYHKFILLRIVKSPHSTPAAIIKTVTKLEDFINKRQILFLLRQRVNDPHECLFCMTTTNRLERVNRQFNEEGFTTDNSLAHKELILHEGQQIELNISGNLETKDGSLPAKFCFNSQFKNQLRFDVLAVDKFAQKSFDHFAGFVEVYTFMMVEHKIQDKESHRIRIERVLERVRIAELCIKIPKDNLTVAELDFEPRRDEISIRSEDIIDEKLFRQLADELGTEWRSLAKHLGIRRSRINAIFETFESKGPEICCFEAFLTWYKQTAKSVNKVEALTRALSVIGRPDLAENVSDLYKDYKREKSDKTAAEKMRIAFIRIAQDEQIIRSWQQLPKALQVSDSSVDSIRRLNLSVRDKCMHVLNDWKSQPGSNLTILHQRLRQAGFANAARLVKRIDQEGL